MKIFVNHELKADLPTNNPKHHNFNAILELYLHGSDWGILSIVKDDDIE